MVGFNILHVAVLGGALLCAHGTLREMEHRPLTPGRLAAPVLLAFGCTLVFLLFHLGAHKPAWTFLAALGMGLVVGTMRGLSLALEVDHMFGRARLPRARGSFLVACGLIAIVLAEIAGALVGEAADPLRAILPELAAFCAGVLAGRAGGIAVRWRRAPHVDLHRA